MELGQVEKKPNESKMKSQVYLKWQLIHPPYLLIAQSYLELSNSREGEQLQGEKMAIGRQVPKELDNEWPHLTTLIQSLHHGNSYNAVAREERVPKKQPVKESLKQIFMFFKKITDMLSHEPLHSIKYTAQKYYMNLFVQLCWLKNRIQGRTM